MAVFTQFVMQHRILAIVRRKLIVMSIQHGIDFAELSDDLKASVEFKGSTDAYLWKLLAYLENATKDLRDSFGHRILNAITAFIPHLCHNFSRHFVLVLS